ncbi:hypothetical protein [Arthrobacter sp. LjRoot14]|uniref:hypothetical protein n=1 Tax=Arthrobacter sp. LjRoot14 TaxID=3342265 RepID=UPI003ECDD571
MDLIIGLVVVLGIPALIACLWYWLSRRNGRNGAWRGATGGMLGIADEIFRPETHHAQQIQVVQHELPAPAPNPADPPDHPPGDSVPR